MHLKEIEKVTITCLVDNNVDLLLPETAVAHRPAIAANWYERPLIAEHGFSAAVTIESDENKQVMLIDSGLDSLAAVHNAEVLGFELSDCKLVVSSHGHIDHAGGLLDVRNKMNKEKLIPIVIHPDAFRNRMVKLQDGKSINLPAPNRSLLRKSGYEIVETNSHSMWLDDSVLVTGEIVRTNNFEKGFPNHFSEAKDGEMESDPLIKDDQAVVLNVKDKGLVVITGCGHAGIINTINHAKELTGEDRICAVIGGMHLSGRVFESLIPKTMDEMQALKPDFVVPCHCSGFRAMTEIAQRMPNAFIQNGVGTNYTF